MLEIGDVAHKTSVIVLLVQKEVEEERQARVGQVSDLLCWVKGLQRRTGGPNVESSLPAQQVQYNKYYYSTKKFYTHFDKCTITSSPL